MGRSPARMATAHIETLKMLTYRLIHPPLLDALASIGHGSRILLADGNFPLRTETNPLARIIYLNLAPGMVTIGQVLGVLQDAVNFESGTLMQANGLSPAQDSYRTMLGKEFPFEWVDRFDFYTETRAAATGLVIATGDRQQYANLLLTIGLS